MPMILAKIHKQSMFLCLYIKFALCYQVPYSLDVLEFVWRHQTLFVYVSLQLYI